MGSNRVSDQKYQQMLDSVAPVTLPPPPAYGPEPITWIEHDRPQVWAWIQWPDRVAERVPATVQGHNDRVVMISFYGDRGERYAIVWRNAVRLRNDETPPTTSR